MLKKQKARPLFGTVQGGLIGNGNAPLINHDRFAYDIGGPITLEPGECRVFSPAAGSLPQTAVFPLTLVPGFRLKGGHYAPLLDSSTNKPMAIPSNYQITISAASFDTMFLESGKGTAEGVGIYMDVNVAAQVRLSYRMVYEQANAQKFWPTISRTGSFAESASLTNLVNNPTKFMFNLFGARVGSKSQIAAKGFVQSSPLSTFTSMGKRNDGSAFMANYRGSDHPVNSPFDYSFETLTGGEDTGVPNDDDESGIGYIITGFKKDTGLSRCVVAEVATRPLLSLAELTHWDSRYENAVPPFAFNIIANSDATPLIKSDQVVDSGVANLRDNLQHDDSYCMNHLLFDDWFVSSLAPDPTSFGSSGKDLKTVTREFTDGTSPLGNRTYRPLQEDIVTAPSASADSFFKKEINTADSWKTIASRLQVDGMFNVNSTSVTAWRALLGHARNQRVPYQNQSGNSVSVKLAASSDHAVSRLSVAGAPEASVAGPSGTFGEANEFAGYRVLDDTTIDFLAKEVVRQIRARGPFLSLAEFVNRQLSEGHLALAGTIQTALNKLAEEPGKNPFSVISNPAFTKLSGVIAKEIDPEYQFPEAAVGNSAYGLPGWIRQADILRPITPILSARDDTFTIRGYGDARDKGGTIIKARAVCEATVTRDREFVDAGDDADVVGLPGSLANLRFGRQFKIISFRWLSPSEI